MNSYENKNTSNSLLMNLQLQQTESNKRLEVVSLSMDALGEKVSGTLVALYESVNFVSEQNERISLTMADINATLLLLARRLDQVEQKVDLLFSGQSQLASTLASVSSTSVVQTPSSASASTPARYSTQQLSPRSNSSSPEFVDKGFQRPTIDIKVTEGSSSTRKKNRKDKSVRLSDVPKAKSSENMGRVEMIPPSFIGSKPPTSKFMSVKWHQTGPSPLDISTLGKEEYARQEAIFELEASEEDYLGDLKACLDFYLKGIVSSGILALEEIEGLFSTIKKLSEGSEKFLLTMKERRKSSAVIDCIGESFSILELCYPAYETYCSNHPKATKLLAVLMSRDDFRDICQSIRGELPENKGQSLESYLIKPIQRICKYPLLFKQILHRTSPKTRDYHLITSSMGALERQLERINDNTPSGDEESRLIFYQSHLESSDGLTLIGYRLVHEGKVEILEKGELKERVLLLLGDRLVILKPYKGVFSSTKYSVKQEIPSEMFLVGVSSSLSGLNKPGFQLVWAGKDKFDIACQTEEEKDKWTKLIDKCYQGKFRDGPRKISSGLNLFESLNSPKIDRPRGIEKSRSFNDGQIEPSPSNPGLSSFTSSPIDSSTPTSTTSTASTHGYHTVKSKSSKERKELSELINEMEDMQKTKEKETLERRSKKVTVVT